MAGGSRTADMGGRAMLNLLNLLILFAALVVLVPLV